MILLLIFHLQSSAKVKHREHMASDTILNGHIWDVHLLITRWHLYSSVICGDGDEVEQYLWCFFVCRKIGYYILLPTLSHAL